MSAENKSRPLIYVVDDDAGIREALGDFFELEGIDAEFFSSGEDLLAASVPKRVDCLLLDLQLPGPSGLDLQQHLAAEGSDVPIVFMSGYGDVPTSVRAMKHGAIDFLTKPLNLEELRAAVMQAVESGELRKEEGAELDRVKAMAASLSRREQEVMDAVVRGLLNKQIAYELGIAEITVKLHRGRVMRKLESTSIADLVRKAELLRHAARAK